MIQRKQTLFLMIATALLTAMIFMSLATAKTNIVDQTMTSVEGTITKTTAIAPMYITLNAWELKSDGESIVGLYYFAAVLILSSILSFLAIFLYRKRLVQIRLCYVVGVLIIGVMIFQALYYYRLHELTTMYADLQYVTVPSISNVFSPIALIMIWLAYRGIVSDEALVRAADRLR